jgi:ribonuclease HI
MEKTTLPRVTVYTDGACEPNPGPGGWAALLRFQSSEKVLQGRADETTNNRMELTAAIEALSELNTPCRVDLYTDSQYLQRGITEWLPRWVLKNWRGSSGKIANQDLWQALATEEKKHEVEWHWLRGHAGDRDNTRVDRLACQAMRGQFEKKNP